jgi:hypothetical protein
LEVTQGWRKLHCEELHDFTVTSYCQGVGLRPARLLAGIASSNSAGCVDLVSLANVVLSDKGLSATGLSIVQSGPSGVCCVRV